MVESLFLIVQFGAYELGKNLLGTYYRESTYTNFIAGRGLYFPNTKFL